MAMPEFGAFYIVDVFSSTKYQGNPLAVVFGHRDPQTMQAIAREMNYSETTFVGPPLENGAFPVRIYTPGQELPFAGHPTLGTAYVLRQMLGAAQEPLVLQEGVGPILVHVETTQDGERYWMTQNTPVFGRTYDPGEIARQLSLPVEAIDAQYPIQEVSTGLPALIVPLKSLEYAKRARNQTEAHEMRSPSVLVFCRETVQPSHDLHIRVFVNEVGIPEDPATGSANGCLAAYLAHYDVLGTPVEVVVEQGVEMGRPSTLYLRAHRGPAGISIRVGGHVSAVARGQLLD